jgi:nickel/cobalt exporter
MYAFEIIAAELSFWNSVIAWIFAQQKSFHRELTEALRLLAADDGMVAASGLIIASFLYGAFHAAGPGHGKAVLAAYLIANPEQVRRGMLLAGASALCQGMVAIILVYGLIYLAGWLPRETSQAVDWSERLSFAIIMAIGGMLIIRAWRSFRHYGHNEHCGCGHSHTPSQEQLAQASDWKTSIGVILSIGLRPCTGAILVLVFAKASGIAWAGIAAVLAMSIGTGIAVALMAYLTVNFRSWVGRKLAQRGAIWRWTSDILLLLGGLTLASIGLSLLIASFAPKHPLGLSG